jgi:hypothetical protein
MQEAMRRLLLCALLATLVLAPAACGRRNTEIVISTPAPGVRIVNSVSRGNGPLSGDFSELSAVFERSGEKDKKLVLSGTYLEIDRIDWRDPHNATICLRGGYTHEFSNNVTLNAYAQRVSYELHFSLREDCQPVH